MRYTKARARQTIEQRKDSTGYFDGSLSRQDMYRMFRDRFGFGIAETRVIVAALVLAGAKFTEEAENNV